MVHNINYLLEEFETVIINNRSENLTISLDVSTVTETQTKGSARVQGGYIFKEKYSFSINILLHCVLQALLIFFPSNKLERKPNRSFT